jgi:NitT/TauT family transport system substrate-binding protein
MTGTLTPLVLAGGALGFNWLPVFVAQRRGLFERHGLAVELRRLGAVDKATAAVNSGEAQLAISPPEGALADAAVGGALRVVAANTNCLPLTLVARAGVQRIEDLKGAVLGTSSLTEGTALYTQALLARHGLRYPQDYTFNVVGVHQARWQALQAGTIDAALQPPPFNFLAIDAGYTDLGEVSNALPEIAFTALLGRTDWLAAHGPSVTALLRAIGEATAVVCDPGHDDEVLPVMMEITQSDAHYGRRALDYMRRLGAFPRSFVIPEPALATTLRLMVQAGLLAADAVDAARAGVDLRWTRGA